MTSQLTYCALGCVLPDPSTATEQDTQPMVLMPGGSPIPGVLPPGEHPSPGAVLSPKAARGQVRFSFTSSHECFLSTNQNTCV